MSIMYHSSILPATRPRRGPLVGCATRHGNSAWTTSVRALRAVLIAARAHAPRERVPSGDELAELVIDMAGERDRAVLADWHRIAITEQQVERHQLPVISKPDRRYNPARWHEAVETEALGQTFIVNLVREWLDSLLPEPIEDVREREKRQRARMRAALARITRRR